MDIKAGGGQRGGVGEEEGRGLWGEVLLYSANNEKVNDQRALHPSHTRGSRRTTTQILLSQDNLLPSLTTSVSSQTDLLSQLEILSQDNHSVTEH